MKNLETRLAKLEKRKDSADGIAWAELIEAGRAVLRYQDGRRVEATEADIPQGVKVYADLSPDDWDTDNGL